MYWSPSIRFYFAAQRALAVILLLVILDTFSEAPAAEGGTTPTPKPYVVVVLGATEELDFSVSVLTTNLLRLGVIDVDRQNRAQEVFRGKRSGQSPARAEIVKMSSEIGADGVVYVDKIPVNNGDKIIRVSLYSVKSGLVLVSTLFSRHSNDFELWTRVVVNRLNPQFQKFSLPFGNEKTVVIENILPGNLVADLANEMMVKGFKEALKQRFSVVPDVLVQDLWQLEPFDGTSGFAWERNEIGLDKSWRISGSFRAKGQSGREVCFDGVLLSPDGRKIGITVEGKLAELSDLLERFAAKALQDMGAADAKPAWQPTQLAENLYDGARYANSVQMKTETHLLAETSVILGNKNIRLFELRVRALAAENPAVNYPAGAGPMNGVFRDQARPPDMSRLKYTIRALELLAEVEDFRMQGNSRRWPEVANNVMNQHVEPVLEQYFYSRSPEAWRSPLLKELRSRARGVEHLIHGNTDLLGDSQEKIDGNIHELLDRNSLYYEDLDSYLRFLGDLMEDGTFLKIVAARDGTAGPPILLCDWNRPGLPEDVITKERMIHSLLRSKSGSVRAGARFLALCLAGCGYEVEDHLRGLHQELMEQRERLSAGERLDAYWASAVKNARSRSGTSYSDHIQARFERVITQGEKDLTAAFETGKKANQALVELTLFFRLSKALEKAEAIPEALVEEARNSAFTREQTSRLVSLLGDYGAKVRGTPVDSRQSLVLRTMLLNRLKEDRER